MLLIRNTLSSEIVGTKRKINPKSLQNLRPGQSPGRTTLHESTKNRHGVSLTDEGWSGVQEAAKKYGYSVSEFLEQIGRGNLAILELEAIEAFQDALDLAEAQTSIAEARLVGARPLEDVLSEIGLED